MIKVEIPAHSVNAQGNELLTYKVKYPWFIHGEVMTHRVFSRNASSNRAIPLAKMLEEVRSDHLRAEPEFWGAEQRGMSPGGQVSDITGARELWRNAALNAADMAEVLSKDVGLHK